MGVMHATLSLRMQLTYKKKQRLAAGALNVLGRKIKYGAVPTWRKSATPEQIIPERQLAIFSQANELEQHPPSFRTHLFLKCGKCEFTKNFINRISYNSAKAQWNLLWCASCRKTSTARSWLCPCEVQWFSCNIHRAHGFNCKHTPRNRDPVELVAGLADTECLPEPARKKRRLGLRTAALEPKTTRTIELQQLHPVPTICSDNGDWETKRTIHFFA